MKQRELVKSSKPWGSSLRDTEETTMYTEGAMILKMFRGIGR